MNLTLAIDEHLAERARAVARAEGTSLNELIRRYLEQLVGSDREALAARYRAFDRPREAEGERTWTRDDAYQGRT